MLPSSTIALPPDKGSEFSFKGAICSDLYVRARAHLSLLQSTLAMASWIVVGASRGIGLEFSKQILGRGDHVIATIRDTSQASQLWSFAGSAERGSCQLFECDVSSAASIDVSQAVLGH